jgi:hypothetical protein
MYVIRMVWLSLLGSLAWSAPSQATLPPVVVPTFTRCLDAKDRPELAPSMCARMTVPLDHRMPD